VKSAGEPEVEEDKAPGGSWVRSRDRGTHSKTACTRIFLYKNQNLKFGKRNPKIERFLFIEQFSVGLLFKIQILNENR
jgi:hypothetical protein